MAAAPFVLLGAQIQVAAAWTGVAPGAPGTQTVAGTLTAGVDLSAWGAQVALPEKVVQVDATNFGSGAFRIILAGIKSLDVGLTFNQDFAAAALDAVLRSTLGGIGVYFYIDVKATSAVRSATNPSLVAQLLMSDYNPLVGAVGQLANNAYTWPANGAFTTLIA